METKLKITASWTELKARLQEKYPYLTEKYLTFKLGREEDLVTRIALKLDKTEDEIADVIDDLQAKIQKRERIETFGEKEHGPTHDADRRETENRDAERREKEIEKEL